jgi:hypothetical protein
MYSKNYNGHNFTPDIFMAYSDPFKCLNCNKLFMYQLHLVNRDIYMEWDEYKFGWIETELTCAETIIKSIIE